jgi:hypothetical protein
VAVQNLTQLKVSSPEEIFDVLGRSFRRRATSETLMNQFSSRSHSVFTVHVGSCVLSPLGVRSLSWAAPILQRCPAACAMQVTATVVKGEGVKVTRTSKLNFVDLSGSENLKRRCVCGRRLWVRYCAHWFAYLWLGSWPLP